MMRSRWLSCGIASAILVVALALSAHAATIHVPDDQPTIQAGIDAAVYGDTVLVECGTYYEYSIVMKSGVCLTSAAGQADCVTIDAQVAFARAIDCVDVDGSTTIQGFTITGGLFLEGAGMRCDNSSPTIANVTFIGNYSDGHGVLYCQDSSPTLQNVAFLENEEFYSGGGGGGIRCIASSVTLTDCTFVANAGPGMYCDRTSLLGTRCEFAGNSGRGIDFRSVEYETGDCILTDCRFVENAGGGMNCETYGIIALTLAGCSFVGNTADDSGGGLRVYGLSGEGSYITLAGCSFVGNTANASGGGLYVDGLASLSPSLTNCTFAHNTAEGWGGAAAFGLSADPMFSGCTIVENDASEGGAILVDGGGWGFGDATMTNTVIAFNTGELPLAFGLLSGSSCNDFYGNEGGDPWWGCGSDSNICEDPLFCLDENPDEPYTFHADSPCAAANNPECGQIGAWGVGCESVTPVQAASWGAIKAMYR